MSSVLLGSHRQYPHRPTAPPPPGSVAAVADCLPTASIYFSKAQPAPASPPSSRTSGAAPSPALASAPPPSQPAPVADQRPTRSVLASLALAFAIAVALLALVAAAGLLFTSAVFGYGGLG